MIAPEMNTFPHRETRVRVDGTWHFCTLHRSGGQWRKKHNGRVFYFGADAEHARDRWIQEWPQIVGTKKIDDMLVPTENALTVSHLCESFLRAKWKDVERGDLAKTTVQGYEYNLVKLDEAIGHLRVIELTPQTFEVLSDRFADMSPFSRQNFIVATRAVFNRAVKQELISKMPSFGEFEMLSTRVMRRARNQARLQRKLPTNQSIQTLLKSCPIQIQAIVLLGLNAGLKGMDFVHLSPDEIKQGTLIRLRPKTDVLQIAPLWPETLEAINEVGLPLSQPPGKRTSDVPWNAKAVSRRLKEFTSLAGIDHFNHDSLRHVLASIGEPVDSKATKIVMGQVSGDAISEHYLHQNFKPRCAKVTEAVREWLFDDRTLDVDGEILDAPAGGPGSPEPPISERES